MNMCVASEQPPKQHKDALRIVFQLVTLSVWGLT